MKKHFLFLSIALTVVLAMTSCTTTKLTTSQVGWSNYNEIVAKDYNVVGVVNLESTETIKTGFLSLTKTTEGSRPTYADLLNKAVSMGADDIINVRIDKTVQKKTGPMTILFGGEAVYVYKATALAIKYKDAEPRMTVGLKETLELNDVVPEESF